MDSHPGQRILVVEDNPHTQKLLETILRSNGYAVTLAPDAEEGLRVLQDESVDLVLLDLFLPRANGMQFLRARAELEPERQAPVIVVSATDELDTLRPQLRGLGALLALKKPFDVQELLDGVRTYARKAPSPVTRTGKAERSKARSKARG